MSKLPYVVFDINETLFDLDSLTPHFVRIFGDGNVMREWFAQLILYSEALTLADDYVPFGELAGAVLKMVAAVHKRDISDTDIVEVKTAIGAMPPHPDVKSGLAKLRNAGFRLFALTNNPGETCIRQLERGGILDFFELTFSIDDTARRYKPAREAYRAVEQALQVPPSQLCLVACHTWDTLGATAAGWHGALLRRRGNAPLDVGGQPCVIGLNLDDVAHGLIQRFAN